jgi:hypothetical protein
MPALDPTPRLANYFLHYTSREGAQGICALGEIRPGPSGRIYLTFDLYPFGTDAADRLAILGKPAEVAVLISPPTSSPAGPALIHPVRGRDGTFLRRGGGTEYYVLDPVPVVWDKGAWFMLNEP